MLEPKQFDFTPILGWSTSRYSQFEFCKRRYFYHYYGKHDPELPRATITTLKDLVTIPLEIGSIVHIVIRVLLNRLRRSQATIDQVRFAQYAQRTVSARVESNRFAEAYYGDVTSIEVDDLLPKVQQCLDNLISSDRYGWLAEVSKVSNEDWLIDPPGYGETRIHGLKAYCKVDFLLPYQAEYHILDWKTGKREEEKHRNQMIGYVAWAAYHLEAEPEQFKPIIAYLFPKFDELKQEVGEFEIENFAMQVQSETDEMYAYCADVEKNIPIAKSDFKKIDDQRICAHCNFRGLCYPDLYRMIESNPSNQ